MATTDNPLSAFFRGLQGAQQRAVQQAQQMEENELTRQLRDIQLVNAQRQIAEAVKTPEQRAQEALTAQLISQAVASGGVRATSPGLEGLDVAIAQALTPQAQTALEAGQITPEFATAALAPIEFETPVPGTGGTFVQSPVLARENQAIELSNAIALAAAKRPPVSPGFQIITDEFGNQNAVQVRGAGAGTGVATPVTTPAGQQIKAAPKFATGSRSVLAENKDGRLTNVVLAAGQSLPEGFKERTRGGDAGSLRKEFNALQEVKSYKELDRQMGLMRSAFEQLKTGASKGPIDQALITTYNKILDPTSVVRESEYSRTPEGAALIRRIEGRLQQFVEGGVAFTDEERRDLLQVAEALFARAEETYRGTRDFYSGIAEQTGVNPNLVIGGPREESPATSVPRGTTEDPQSTPIQIRSIRRKQ